MSSSWRRWLPVVLWVGVIYTTIPFVRVIREWYVQRWDPIYVGLAVAIILVATGIAMLRVLSRRLGGLLNRNTVWVVAATSLFVVWTFSLRRSPEETVHFLEYGVLAVLLHRALRPTILNALVFIAAALIGTLIGTVDEVIQWFSPGRFWDWRDLVLNGGASVLTQLILWRVVGPATDLPDIRSRRIVLRLAAAQLVLLTLCLANTPARVDRYAPYLPDDWHLTSSRNPMAEYGHRHTVPGLGTFKSRLTLDELRRSDEGRAAEVGPVLDEYRPRYDEFLDTWSVSDDPFTYEARVHLHARGRNLAKARDGDFSGASATEQASISWFEHRLLEEFFGNTLAHSSYRWGPRLRQQVESAHDPEYSFHSAAGSQLITVASERTIRVILLVVVAGMIVADLLIGRSRGRRK